MSSVPLPSGVQRNIDTSTPVVVLGMEGQFGLNIARSLGRLGIDVYVLHRDLSSPGATTRYVREVLGWKLDARNPDASIEYLLSLARRLGRQPILLASEEEGAIFMAENKRDLEGAFCIACPSAGLVSALANKRDLSAICEKHLVPTPATLAVPKSRSELEAFAAHATFPVVVKALVQWARYPPLRTTIVSDREGLLESYDQLQITERPNVLVQQHIAGEGSTWMFTGYFNQRAEPLAAFTGRKLRDWPPGCGQATLGVCVRNEALAAEATRFLKAVGYWGPVDMDFRQDPVDGCYRLVDVNPRLGCTFRLFEDPEGLDVPRVLYLDLTDQPRRAGQPPEGRRWLLEDRDFAASRRQIRNRTLTPSDWIRSLRTVDETAWLARDDLWPFARGLGRWTRRRLTEAARRMLGRSGRQLQRARRSGSNSQNRGPG